MPPCGRQFTPCLDPIVDPVRPLLDKRWTLQYVVLKSLATSLTRACHLLDNYIIALLPISDAELLKVDFLERCIVES